MIVAILGTSLAQAQGSLVGRLFFEHYGDLWSWGIGDDAPTRHTTGSYHSGPTISSTGTHLAFQSFVPEAWGNYGYDVSDIWLWDLQTDTMTPITTNVDFA